MQDLKNDLETALAGARTVDEVGAVRNGFLGKKGTVSGLLKSLRDLDPEERRRLGPVYNQFKKFVEKRCKEALEALRKGGGGASGGAVDRVDVALPGTLRTVGNLHPIELVQLEVERVFAGLSFRVLEGFDVETEYANFDSVNIPADHPAREMQDTFWLEGGLLLRTHTSSNQVRAMRECGVPIRAIFPGRCFRYETMDASHENTFYQCEGLMVDRGLTVANLVALMKMLLSGVFGREVAVRLRPGYFPFVEPGFELDIACLLCDGDGCSVCKRTGWVELMPCGMVHPKVLEAAGADPAEFRGLAFGLGLTRLAMMKFAVPDIRLFNSGDVRFLRQFPAGV